MFVEANKRYQSRNLSTLLVLLSLALSGCAPWLPLAEADAVSSPPTAGPGLSPQPPSPQPPVTATPVSTVLPPERRLYVVDPNDQGTLSSLSMIDADTGRIAWILTTRFLPDAVLSPDGSRLYVADSYRTRVTRGEPHDVVSVYDALSGELLVDDVPIQGRLLYKMLPGFSSRQLFLSHDGSLLYVGKYGDPDIHQLRLAVHDAHTLQLLHEVDYPQCGELLRALPDRWLCATPTATGALPAASVSLTIEWLDPLSGAILERIISVDVPPVSDFALSADGARLYVLHTNAAVSVLDLAQRSLGPAHPLDAPAGWQVDGFALASDGNRLYVGFDTGSDESSIFTDAVAVYETATGERVGTLDLPDAINFFTLSRDGSQLYVISPFARRLTSYDTETLQQLMVMEDLGGTPALVLD